MKRPFRSVLAIGVIALLVIAACSDDKSSTTSTSSSAAAGNKPTITIGAQDFPESEILSEIYKQGLAAKGFTTSIQKLGGFRPVELQAFDGKTINFAPEYAASMLEALNNKAGEATSDATETVNKLKPRLQAKDLGAFDVTTAVDTNGFAMTKAKSDSLGIKSLSDLATKGKSLKLGGPADCETNPFCLPGLKSLYGVDLSGSFQALETTAIAPALDNGAIDIGIIFSTDPQLATKYTALTDDKHLLSADNIIPVATTALASNSDLAAAVNAISKKITTDQLVTLNKRVGIDHEDASTVARDFLQQNGLI